MNATSGWTRLHSSTGVKICFTLMSLFAGCGAAEAQVTLSCNAVAFPSSLTIGVEYNLNCVAMGGTSPYTYTVSGSVPPGLNYGQVAGEFIVQGNPAVAGSYAFTIQVTDAAGHTSSQPFTETVAGAATGP